MDVLKRTHAKLAALYDAGHGKNHPELIALLEKLERITETKTGRPVINEQDRRIHYGQA